MPQAFWQWTVATRSESLEKVRRTVTLGDRTTLAHGLAQRMRTRRAYPNLQVATAQTAIMATVMVHLGLKTAPVKTFQEWCPMEPEAQPSQLLLVRAAGMKVCKPTTLMANAASFLRSGAVFVWLSGGVAIIHMMFAVRHDFFLIIAGASGLPITSCV